jgi:hypothetical protein
MPERSALGALAKTAEGTLVGTLQRTWLNFAVVAVLVVFAANQFASEWEMFRASAYPTGSAIDFPHYYVAAKLAGSANPKAHALYYLTSQEKEAVLDRIPADTEWNRIAHQNGLGDTLHFSAPPIIAALLAPLGKLPYQLAFMVWRLLTDVFFFLAIWVCLKLCRALSASNLLVCTLAGFVFQPFALTLEKGQFGAVLLLTWALGTFWAEKKHDVLSALMFALATIVKLTPVLAVGVFALRRRWRWLMAYVLWMSILTAGGVLHMGVENHRLYLAKLSALECGAPGPYAYCLPGIVDNIYYGNVLSYEQVPAHLPAPLCFFNKALGFAVYAGVLGLLLKRNRKGDIAWDLVVLSLLVLLIAPFTWRHYYVLEILPLLFVWFFLKNGGFAHTREVLWIAVFCTLIAGTRYADYLQVHLKYGPARVFLVALLPISALILLVTLLFAYRPALQSEPAS